MIPKLIEKSFKIYESTRERFENGEIQIAGCLNGPSNLHCDGCKNLIPRRKIVTYFFTIVHLFEKKELSMNFSHFSLSNSFN